MLDKPSSSGFGACYASATGIRKQGIEVRYVSWRMEDRGCLGVYKSKEEAMEGCEGDFKRYS